MGEACELCGDADARLAYSHDGRVLGCASCLRAYEAEVELVGVRPLDPVADPSALRRARVGSRRSAAPSIHTSPEGGDRMSSTTTESPAKPKAQPAPKVPEGITVEALVAALREAGVKPKVRWNPKRTYVSLLVGKANIGYVDAPTRKGMKVTPAIAHEELRNGVKKAFAPSGRAGRFGAVLMVTDEKGLGHAVAALVAADAKRQAKEAK
jgi:hypothetical protein